MGKLTSQIKAVIYIRVSSEKQVENYSLDYQEKILRKYAKSDNMQVMKVFREEGYSATNTNRPAYKEMIKYLEENDIDAVLVHKLDRLHRDETNLFNDIKRFGASGIKIIAVADGIDTSKDDAKLATAILAAIGANFSRNLSKETRKGLISAAENCLHTGGKPPYGYRVNRNTMMLEIDETTAPAVRQMFRLYANGFGTSDILKWLKDHGYKTAKGNDFKANTLNEIFHNEKYRGCYTWDKALPKNADGKRNTHGYKTNYIKIEDGCPAIVSDEVFYKVQKRLAENVNRARNRTPDRYYPLTGMIYCSCGGSMCGGVSYSKGRRYHKYKCINKCGEKAIRADYVEAFVINAINTCLFSEPNRDLILSELNKLSENTKVESDREYQQLRSKLSGLETPHENLMQSLEKGKAIDSIMNRLERIEQQKKQVTMKIQHLTREACTFTEGDLQLLQEKFSSYVQFNNSVNGKELLKNVINRIEVGKDMIHITLKSGISIDKTTKIRMKGNIGNMNTIKNTEKCKGIGFILSFGNSEADGCVSVKIALSVGVYANYDYIMDIDIPKEYLFKMATDAKIAVIDLIGAEISAEVTTSANTVTSIDSIEAR